MSAGVPGLVETSNNLATVGIRDDELVIVSSQRSSVVQQLDNLSSRIESLAVSAGAGVSHDSGYPAWQPDSSSPLLERCRRVYGETFDKEPDIQIIHAGLECAVIGSKFPEMDMISFGPTIRNPHSPDEKLYIPSVANTWKFLLALLASFGPECE
jgi:dipeptidase D